MLHCWLNMSLEIGQWGCLNIMSVDIVRVLLVCQARSWWWPKLLSLVVYHNFRIFFSARFQQTPCHLLAFIGLVAFCRTIKAWTIKIFLFLVELSFFFGVYFGRHFQFDVIVIGSIFGSIRTKYDSNFWVTLCNFFFILCYLCITEMFGNFFSYSFLAAAIFGALIKWKL